MSKASALRHSARSYVDSTVNEQLTNLLNNNDNNKLVTTTIASNIKSILMVAKSKKKTKKLFQQSKAKQKKQTHFVNFSNFNSNIYTHILI